MAWGSDWQAAGLLLRTLITEAQMGGWVSSPKRKSRTRSLREGVHQQERALEPGHSDEMGEETG